MMHAAPPSHHHHRPRVDSYDILTTMHYAMRILLVLDIANPHDNRVAAMFEQGEESCRYFLVAEANTKTKHEQQRKYYIVFFSSRVQSLVLYY